MTKYIFIITYNFDGDYLAKSFNTFDEAKQCLDEYLQKEIETTITECEYTPTVVNTNAGGTYEEIVLVYEENFDKNWNFRDNTWGTHMAHYRIFEIEV